VEAGQGRPSAPRPPCPPAQLARNGLGGLESTLTIRLQVVDFFRPSHPAAHCACRLPNGADHRTKPAGTAGEAKSSRCGEHGSADINTPRPETCSSGAVLQTCRRWLNAMERPATSRQSGLTNPRTSPATLCGIAPRDRRTTRPRVQAHPGALSAPMAPAQPAPQVFNVAVGGAPTASCSTNDLASAGPSRPCRLGFTVMVGLLPPPAQ